MWLVVALVLVLVAGAGLTGYVLLDQRKDSEETAAASYPAQWDPQIAPYVRIVEKERGLTFVHPVEVRYLTGEQFEKAVTADEDDLDNEAREEIRQFTGLMRAVGLIGGDVDLFKAFNDAYGSGTLAYYSYKDERVTIRGTKLTSLRGPRLCTSSPTRCRTSGSTSATGSRRWRRSPRRTTARVALPRRSSTR